MPWTLRGVEALLDRWIADDQPDFETRMAVGSWLMQLRDDPASIDSYPIPSIHTAHIACVPGTSVWFLYALWEQTREIVGAFLATMSD